MILHSNWRDTKAWKDLDLELSTTSNEAAKLYDASLSQYAGRYEDASVGGLEKSLADTLKADPNFVMGHVILKGIHWMGTGTPRVLDPELKSALDDLSTIAAKSKLTERETKHVAALVKLAKGYMAEAAEIWEDILLDHPTDMLALRMAHDSYFYMGRPFHMRDSLARVFPYWTPTMPLYGCLYGLYSFGLVETNLYNEAERVAKKGLEINPKDAHSTHSIAHVMEMTGRQDDGITFMSRTVKEWSSCELLACHNFWHWALYHLEKAEYQEVLDLYDSEIGKRLKSGAMLDFVDSASLLYRLEMDGVNIGNRWDDVYEACRPHIDDHLMAFNDVHILMSCLGAKQKETAQKMMDSLETFVRKSKGTNHEAKIVGQAICKALFAYDEGDYVKATDLLAPIKYEIVRIGGSNAERDVFNQFLIQAALKSPEKRHKKLARYLLTERKALKENSPLTDRMMAKALAEHHD